MYLEGDSISTLKYSMLYLDSDMLFRIRYYIRIHILYLVRTDVPNCQSEKAWPHSVPMKDFLAYLVIEKWFSLTHLSLASFLWDMGKQCRPRSDAAERGV